LRSEALPNLLIIGAMKCGTTSLHRYLDLHPEISMSSPKELRFFDDPAWRDRIDWYTHHFDPAAAVSGESTVYYSAYPWIPDVPQRIHELVPHARLIYLVGDPLKRLVAQWVEWCTIEADRSPEMLGKWARLPFSEVLADYEAPGHPVVCPSRYATQLEQYLALFPKSRVMVVDQDDLKHSRMATLQAVFRFLDVDDGFVSPEFADELNTHGEKSRAWSSYSLVRRALLACGAHRFPSSTRGRIGQALRSVFSRPVAKPTIDGSVRAGLAEHLREEADRLRELTGKALPHWSV
jgi:sulfotransferase family protein